MARRIGARNARVVPSLRRGKGFVEEVLARASKILHQQGLDVLVPPRIDSLTLSLGYDLSEDGARGRGVHELAQEVAARLASLVHQEKNPQTAERVIRT